MISERLKAIASLVHNGENVIDIGCDHGLLDIYLTLHNNNKCIASDINENALNQAKKNINKYNLENKIKTILSDGLNNIEINEKSTIIISGMGTSNIIKIVNKIDDQYLNDLIISSHNEYEILRKELSKKYIIVDEIIVKDKNKFYLILKLNKGHKKYNKKDFYLGPILKNKNNDIIKNYYEYLFNSNNLIINKIPNKHIIKKLNLIIKNNWIKKLNRK